MLPPIGEDPVYVRISPSISVAVILKSWLSSSSKLVPNSLAITGASFTEFTVIEIVASSDISPSLSETAKTIESLPLKFSLGVYVAVHTIV